MINCLSTDSFVSECHSTVSYPKKSRHFQNRLLKCTICAAYFDFSGFFLYSYVMSIDPFFH